MTLALMISSFAVGRAVVHFHGLPTIAATLSGGESEFSHELDVKIRELFPIGTSEEKLIGYLQTEGFAPDWRRRNEPNESSSFHSGLICTQIAHVFWRADPAGILTEVSGSYESQCV